MSRDRGGESARLEHLIATGALGVLIVGSAGIGLCCLSVSAINKRFTNSAERFCAAFTLGFGLIGWFLFFPGVVGWFDPLLFWAVTIGGVFLFAHYRNVLGTVTVPKNYSRLEIILIVALSVVLALDLIEGLSPPADADTLAYHFRIPSDFIKTGQVEFIPRAISGAIPLLVQMTYAAALGMGGELTLTLWTTVLGWTAPLILGLICGRAINRSAGLAIATILLTTPAFLYGGGNGQVEVKCAAFVLVAVWALIEAKDEISMPLYAIAGLSAGFFIGAKYYGLIFAGACGLLILLRKGGMKPAVVFGAAALTAGFQWYFWNWFHTGDPVFPVLFNLLQYPDTEFWTGEFGRFFSENMASGELPLDRSIRNWILYPVFSIFNVVPGIESGRTGFGALIAITFPFALIAIARREMRQQKFMLPLAVFFIFFTVWFFSGTAQRTRHLAPVYPLLLLCFIPLAIAFASRGSNWKPLVFGLICIVTIQIAGQTIYSLNYIRYVFSNETREEFLVRNVPGANGALWINENLPPDVRVAFMNRQLAYIIDRRTFTLHPYIQKLVDARPATENGEKFIREALHQNITHMLLPDDWGPPYGAKTAKVPFFRMIRRLEAEGCLRRLASFKTLTSKSRTLRQLGTPLVETRDALFKLDSNGCRARS